ncbi:MAG: class I SAM-dependent methyltransferase [Pseudomonadota bacterium]
MPSCRICHNVNGNRTYRFREMMFGSEDVFEYFQCANCGCLQIKEIRDNLFKYYDDEYYSFQRPDVLFDNVIKAFFKHQRARFCLEDINLFRRVFLKIYRPPDYFNWLKRVNIRFESEILDVGCGTGHLLVRMKRDGFQNLTGVDAFIKEDIYYENGVKLLKKDLSGIDGRFDFIMLHHSYEHMSDPLGTIQALYRLLKPGRYVLIRIPVASSHAWESFGENWVQLDVPRHLFLHTVKSMGLLADQSGFVLEEIVFDSTDFQFWGSEQYRRGIPLRGSRSFAENPRNSIFSKKDINGFKARAKELNEKQMGDQACFYLYKL